MIIRTNKDHNPFVMLDKTALNDSNLSWKAKGLHAFMMSKPDHWTFYMENLEKASKDGRESLRSAFKELQKHGYVIRKPHQNNQGKLDGWETIVNEKPVISNRLTENPTDGKPVGRKTSQAEKPSDGKPATSNNDFSNNDSSKNNSSKKDKDIVADAPALPFETIINYLNEKAGTSFKHTTKRTQEFIRARYNERFTTADFKTVIDIKVDEWLHDSEFNRYLRPETLFSPKFESYLNQKPKGANTHAGHQSTPKKSNDTSGLHW